MQATKATTLSSIGKKSHVVHEPLHTIVMCSCLFAKAKFRSDNSTGHTQGIIIHSKYMPSDSKLSGWRVGSAVYKLPFPR